MRKRRRLSALLWMLLWGLWMQNTAGEYTPYLLILSGGLLSWAYLGKTEEPVSGKIRGFALLLSACVVLGNISKILWPYPTFLSLTLTRMAGFVLVSVGSYKVFRQIFGCLWLLARRSDPPEIRQRPGARVFFGAWAILGAAYSLVLWLAFYPGIFSIDNVRQLRELMGMEPMSNANPYYHTRLIGLFLRLGMKLTGDMAVGVALYSQFSVLTMSACFAYGIYVLWQETGNKWAVGLLGAYYLLSPMHILYSFTMWKDVLFSGAVMTFALSLFRAARGVRRARVPMLVSALGMCLMRVNGVMNLAVTVAAAAVICPRQARKKLLPLAGVAAAGFVLVFPLLSWLGIAQSDPVEALSVPIQQVGYLIREDCVFSEEDRALLEQLVDLDKVPDAYKNYISDPMKALLREKGNLEYLQTHKFRYLSLYLRLGAKYPLEYLQAWSEQTKGYWEGGYEYDHWNIKIDQNPWGLRVTPRLPILQSALRQYLDVWESSYLTKLTLCLGAYFWLCLGCLFVGITRKDRAMVFGCLPYLTVVGLLAVGTPVFAEFRYGYPLVCGVPVLLGITVCALRGEIRGEFSREEEFFLENP